MKVNSPLLHSSLLIAFISIIHLSNAQTVENVTSTFEGAKVMISYDLVFDHPGVLFDVQVFSSHNNYVTPVSQVTGDVGEDISPGKGKNIVWDAGAELPEDFNDFVSIKVKAAAMNVPDYQFSPLPESSFKRERYITLNWSGGLVGEPVRIDLLNNGQVVQNLTRGKDGNSYYWQVPKKLKTGSGYNFQISGAYSTDRKAISQPFKVKSKIPLIVKLSPIILGGAVAAIIATSGGGGGKDNPSEPELSELPMPIDPNN